MYKQGIPQKKEPSPTGTSRRCLGMELKLGEDFKCRRGGENIRKKKAASEKHTVMSDHMSQTRKSHCLVWLEETVHQHPAWQPTQGKNSWNICW